MVSAIVYLSKTGSAKRYAELLSEALKVPAYALENAPEIDGKIIYLGWALARKTSGLPKARKKYDLAAVVQVGMSPAYPERIEEWRKANELSPDVAFFCVRGEFDLDKLSGPSRLIMKKACKDMIETFGAIKEERELSPQENAIFEMAKNGKGEPPAWDVSKLVGYFTES